MAQRTYNADQWLTSLVRGLQDYVGAAFDPDIVAVQMDFPDLTKITNKVPLAKTIVHMEMDDDMPTLVGMGKPGDAIFDAGTGTVIERVADAIHTVNFDVGIWASQQTGGATSRMEVHETLSKLLTGPVADEQLAAATNGIHLVLPGLAGGRYILDEFNDVPIWRALEMTLSVRVYSRYTPPAEIAVDTVDVDLATYIDGSQLAS